MEKLLLLGAATLMCASAAWAGVRYVPVGEPLSGTPSEVLAAMKAHEAEGGLFFIQMNKKEAPKSSFLYSANKTMNQTQLRWDYDGVTEIDPAGDTDTPRLFRLEFGENANFTVQSVYSSHFISTQGQVNVGQHNAYVTDGSNYTIARYTIEELPDKSILKADDPLKDNRFLVKVTNATRANGSDPIYWQSYNNVDPISSASFAYVSYQSWTSGNQTAQVAFVPAKRVVTIPVTVKFPDWNGLTMTEEVEAVVGEDPTIYIADAANAHGGLENMQITSENGTDLIVSETNKSFIVTGDWNYDFEENQVYRICLAPTDHPSALRYMISTGEIKTKIDGTETLSRLIPERLWFFKAGSEPNTFSLHNLYDPTKGVKFTPAANGSYNGVNATYEEDYTYFELVHSSVDNQFKLKIAGTTNAYVNDFKSNGFFSIWETTGPDNNCILQLYPLEAKDMEALGLPTTTDPTFENIKDAVAEYNARNIAAALRRVGYWIPEEMIGWQPGRFDNADRNFTQVLADARAMQAKIDAGEEVDETERMALVDALDFHNLTFNEIEAGKFYRFKNKKSGKYISTDEWGTYTNNNGSKYQLTKLVNAELAKYDNTIFYIDGTENGSYTLVSYQTGLVLPDYSGSATDWTAKLSSDEHAGHSFLIQHQHLGGCILHSTVNGGHRHLHGGGQVPNMVGSVNVAGNETNDEYQWYVELVEDLPVTFFNVMGQAGSDSDEGWASVYSPVALEIPAEYTHTTAYTGTFDATDYTGQADINHIHAQIIEPNDEGKVIIPANQPALLFYDGKVTVDENEFLDQTEDRNYVVYLNLPIVFDHVSTEPIKGNLSAQFKAFANPEEETFLTLHASSNNNFRPIEKFNETASYIPGFKAYIDEYPTVEGAEEVVFPIYTVNPNTMVPLQDEEGYKVALSEDDPSKVIITVVTENNEYEVYYKQTSTASAAAPARRAASTVDHTGYNMATKNGNVHTMEVEDGNVEYYAYHVPSNVKGAVRTATVDTTGLDAIITEGSAAKVYDLQGRKLAAPAKGFNIINGQKVLVK